MAKKTNKTSHVMDLLTNGASGESTPANDTAASDASAAAGQEKKGDVQSHSVTPKKVTVVDEGSRNDRVSQEILSKLSEELEEDNGQGAASSAPAETSNRTMNADEIAAAFAAAPAKTASQAAEGTPAPAETSNRTMSADEIAAAFAAAQQPAAAPAENTAAPAETSNRTMSADEIAAAFASAQQPTAAPAESTAAPAETSNRTMNADEIAAAFAAAQQPAATSAENTAAPAEAAPAPQTDNAPVSPDTSSAKETAPVADAAPSKITPKMVIPKSQISDNLAHDDYRFVNVMEQLILRQDIDSYLEQYNVCKCKRCVSDVCALALTGLPSKYVVTSKDSLSPILSYYESKFRIYMLTELIKACNKVRENPRHKK